MQGLVLLWRGSGQPCCDRPGLSKVLLLLLLLAHEAVCAAAPPHDHTHLEQWPVSHDLMTSRQVVLTVGTLTHTTPDDTHKDPHREMGKGEKQHHSGQQHSVTLDTPT